MASPLLVDPEVSRSKLERQVKDFQDNGASYRERGYWIVDQEGLNVYAAFAARIPMSIGPIPFPVVTACVRFNFDNFDLWAPSLTIVDFFTLQPAMPLVNATEFGEGEPLNVLIGPHPETQLPFLCLPGVREYHTHPQHTGDLWLLRRSITSLSSLAEQVWMLMARNVVGIRLELARNAAGVTIGLQLVQAKM